jgi:hypothetical protein
MRPSGSPDKAVMASGARRAIIERATMYEQQTVTMQQELFRYLDEEARRTGLGQDELLQFAVGALAYLRMNSDGAAVVLWRDPEASDSAIGFNARQVPLAGRLFSRLAQLPGDDVLSPKQPAETPEESQPTPLRLVVSNDGD